MENAYSVGEYVFLRHPTRVDAENDWYQWFSDEETTRWLTDRFLPNSKEKQLKFFESLESSNDRLVLSIVEKENLKHIGVCGLSGISWRNQYCDLSIIIGDPEYRTGPPLMDSWRLLLKIAFFRLNMRVLKSHFISTNERSKVIHDVFGFKHSGKIPGLIFSEGKYVDLVTSYLLRDDWMERNKLI